MPYDFAKLAEPFPPEEVEWRFQRSGLDGENPWALVLAYITNRAIMQRLDDVIGVMNWKNEYTKGPEGGILCGISLWNDNQWITKWDGSENTEIEEVKGGLSGAMKRAAVQWGIGRYLYNLDSGYAIFTDKGKYKDKIKDSGKYYRWNPPELPAWALPKDYQPTSDKCTALIAELGITKEEKAKLWTACNMNLSNMLIVLESKKAYKSMDEKLKGVGV